MFFWCKMYVYIHKKTKGRCLCDCIPHSRNPHVAGGQKVVNPRSSLLGREALRCSLTSVSTPNGPPIMQGRAGQGHEHLGVP